MILQIGDKNYFDGSTIVYICLTNVSDPLQIPRSRLTVKGPVKAKKRRFI